jgi:hypothetical protein
MFKKSRIAMLVAGALFAMQTGLAIGQTDDDAISLSASASSSGPEQLTVFNPDGSSYSMTPVDVQVALAVEPDEMWAQESALSSGPQELTVFNPNGSSYSIAPIEVEVAMLEPTIVIAADESLWSDSLASDESVASDASVAWDESLASDSASTHHATVFHPDGTSYNIVSSDIEIAVLEPTLTVMADESLPEQVTVFEPSGQSYSYEYMPIEVAMLEPIDVVMLGPIDVLVMEEDITIQPIAVIDEDADTRPTYVAHFVSPPEYTGILEETLS